MKEIIYADNAATTHLSPKALEKMLPYLEDKYGNASQFYSFARSPKKALKESREVIAECIGSLPEEIYFTSCGTESDNWVIAGAVKLQLPIITSLIEHHAILRPCEVAKKNGCKVDYLPVSIKGVVDTFGLDQKMKNSSSGLLSVMFANNEIGTIQPISKLAKIAHQHGWYFHTDAVQAIGHTPINVKEMGIDMLSASAHKFNGPKGIGFLYIKKDIEWPSIILGGAQENNHRAGTENVASIVGMATALQENVSRLDENMKHLFKLEMLLVQGLQNSGVCFLRNGGDEHVYGNVSLSFPGYYGEAIMHRLDLLGIEVSTGSACDSKETQISHVLKSLGIEANIARGTIRISLGRYNTEMDVVRIVDALVKILK